MNTRYLRAKQINSASIITAAFADSTTARSSQNHNDKRLLLDNRVHHTHFCSQPYTELGMANHTANMLSQSQINMADSAMKIRKFSNIQTD